MATAKKVWKGEATLLATNGYSGGTSDLAADQAYDYSADIDLETDGYEGALVFLEHDSAGTTDDIVLSIFPSIDGSDFADNPIYSQQFTATSGADTGEAPVVVKDLSHFRVGVKTTGTTDTFDYRIRWDAWRWDVS